MGRPSSKKLVIFRIKCCHKSTVGATDATAKFTCLGLKWFNKAWLAAALDEQNPFNMLLYVNSATDIDRSLALKGVPPSSSRHTVVEVHMVILLLVTKKLYDPIALYTCNVIRPKFLISCAFSPTKFVHRSLSLPESVLCVDAPLALLGTFNETK